MMSQKKSPGKVEPERDSRGLRGPHNPRDQDAKGTSTDELHAFKDNQVGANANASRFTYSAPAQAPKVPERKNQQMQLYQEGYGHPPYRGRPSPERRKTSPDKSKMSPERQRVSPDRRRISPERRRPSPDRRRLSPDRRRLSPDRQRRSIDRRTSSPDRRKYIRERRRATDEIMQERNWMTMVIIVSAFFCCLAVMCVTFHVGLYYGSKKTPM